ncbi:hypothetical protein PC129_g15010 [Phytophthora cactorum]|uniref:Uncharacterized protein n=1 Tax=Phytophthora cactorum TaxID=29920 RepID=A0A8T1C655_9STRA|nr:hypothetical protein PC115_g11656 [Phytophthora cactorum]KAG2934602.1 hypothetical protein PC117_g12603 [Phytophthora cactorum]KAG3011474.1 hypothetical protein PC119_g13214 [Phytophthora cactorum]KAG3214069.1 hypothetical protein PC129_g15010 [Phytophthora cactorum]
MIQQLMDGDELQALEAALAFLDDCNGGVGGFLSDPSTDDSGSRMPGVSVEDHGQAAPTN